MQTLQSGRRAVGTNGRSVESFCDNLGVGAGANAVDKANKWLPQKEAPDVLHDVRTAAHKQAKDDCRGKYGSAYLRLAGLLAAAVAFGWALVRRARGRSGGRPSVMTADKLQVAREMHGSGQYTVAAIAKTLGVSRASIYRHLTNPDR